MDKKKIKKAVELLIEGSGDDKKRNGLSETPARVAEMYEELLSGASEDAAGILKKTTESEHEELVLLKDISFYSLCEHHLVPFFGTAHIAYIPAKKRILGFSTMAKFIDSLAKRLQTQERLTTMAADIFMEEVKPKGVMVVVEARHLCMEMRGIKKPNSVAVTSAVRGIFRKDEKTRAEAFALIRK